MAQRISFEKISGLLAGLAVVMIWSGWIIISKWGISHALTVWDVTGIRFLTATFFVLIYAYFSKASIKALFTPPIIICSLCCGTFYVCASLIGLLMSDAANTGVIINGSLPIMCAAILFIWKKNRLHIPQYIGILLILIANVLLFTSSGGASLSALIWLLIAAFSIAFYSVSMKIWRLDLKTIMISVPLVNALFFTPIWFFLPSNLAAAPIHEIALQGFYQGIVVSIIALFCMTYSINRLGAVSASTIMALVPIMSVLLALLFLDQHMSLQVGISILLCSVGIACYSALHPFLVWLNKKQGN
ncbi:DMT family transporter [Psychromonas sp. RZ22]|uniref:DMT family transporter n=1 Tax=Psychromonas algarum TaxID=2555643 RepID=UPI001067E87E|nr:DMT family transporter [Psychromonas sp. RZ22]TEW56510.1 DMT family transporter [Psychromonas sp. RZ22]